MAYHYLAPNASQGNPSVAPTPVEPQPARYIQLPKGSKLRPSPTPHLTRSQYVLLLAVIEEEGGIATLDRIARAMPEVSQPVNAVLDLCDVGILGADLVTAFDGQMPVWRRG